MDQQTGESNEAVLELERFLLAATSAPPAVPSSAPPGKPGWYSAPPGAGHPWSNMHDVTVTAVPGGVVVTTRWDQESELFVIPMGSSNMIAQYELDRWITMLELHLDRPSWRDRAIRIGTDTRLVVIPSGSS